MKLKFLLVGMLVMFFSVESYAKDIKGFMTVNLESIKLTKKNWGDFGDNSAELSILMFSESYSGKKSHHLIPAASADPLSASLNQSIRLDEYDGISIPLRDDTARVYIMAIDNDEKGFKQDLAENTIISFIGDKINKNAAKFLYKVKNATVYSWLISEAAEQSAYTVKAFLEKNQILGTAIIEINANKNLEGKGNVKSEENSFEVFYKTTFRKNTDSSNSSHTTTQTTNKSKWITPSNSVCKSNGGEVDGDGCLADWEDAKNICSASGGRLPTIDELKKVVTDCGGEMKDDTVEEWKRNQNNSNYQSCYKQKGFTSNYYWSSTTDASYTNYAWGVNFDNGYTNYGSKSDNGYVRCVRAGQ